MKISALTYNYTQKDIMSKSKINPSFHAVDDVHITVENAISFGNPILVAKKYNEKLSDAVLTYKNALRKNYTLDYLKNSDNYLSEYNSAVNRLGQINAKVYGQNVAELGKPSKEEKEIVNLLLKRGILFKIDEFIKERKFVNENNEVIYTGKYEVGPKMRLKMQGNSNLLEMTSIGPNLYGAKYNPEYCFKKLHHGTCSRLYKTGEAIGLKFVNEVLKPTLEGIVKSENNQCDKKTKVNLSFLANIEDALTNKVSLELADIHNL